MRHLPALALLLASTPLAAQLQPPGNSQPAATAPFGPAVPEARDVPYPGTMILKVDATDTRQGVFSVEQTIPVAGAGPLVLLLPEWLPGNHAPRGQISNIAGVRFEANGRPVAWARDPVNVFAFRLEVPAGATAVTARFQYVSPVDEDQGRVVMTPAMMNIQWELVSLYPAGYFTRRIPVQASVTYPAGWQAGTALRPDATSGATVTYKTVDYDTLVDSPVFAGAHFRRVKLTDDVTLNIVADEEANLAFSDDQIAAHRRLAREARALFGANHFDHYDFLLALTDEMGGIGLEHHRSSENGVDPEYFTDDWADGPGRRTLLPHEMTHSWNGKHRRPADLWTPDFATPMRDSGLWVYEGQTQFWGTVLSARSGLLTKQQTLDIIAQTAAGMQQRVGREWRPLIDTTNDPVLSARRPKPWASWQRSEDYYNEGLLIWLEVDAILRNRSGGKRSLDDFARAFFGGKDGDWGVVTYDRADVIATLNRVQPYDWAGLLAERLDRTAAEAPLAGLRANGYELAYGTTKTDAVKAAETRYKATDFTYSLGLSVAESGAVRQVVWGSPAFQAGLTNAAVITGVNGRTYTGDRLADAVKASATTPVTLSVTEGSQVRTVALPYTGGPRYPVLRKVGSGVTGLDRLLAPRLGGGRQPQDRP